MSGASVTDIIRAEHDRMRPYLRQVMSAFAPDKTPSEAFIKATASALRKMLDSHSRLEDEVIFSKLDQAEPWVIHVTNEHVEISRDLDGACAGSRKCLRHVADLSLGHFDEEEKWVLPAVERTLSPLQLAILGSQWEAARAAGR